MIGRLAIAAIAGAGLVGAEPQYGPFDGFGRGVHVFGNYVIDLGWGQQYLDMSLAGHRFAGPRHGDWPADIILCSNAQFFCLKSSSPGAFVSLVVPRACRDLAVGEEWRVGSIRTAVADFAPGTSPRTTDHPFPDSHILIDPDRSDVAWLYVKDLGVTEIYIANGKAVDLREFAREGALRKRPSKVDGYDAWLVHRISTPDTFAACQWPARKDH